MVFKRIRSVAFFSSEIFQSDDADGVQPRRSESQQHAWAGGGLGEDSASTRLTNQLRE